MFSFLGGLTCVGAGSGPNVLALNKPLWVAEPRDCTRQAGLNPAEPWAAAPARSPAGRRPAPAARVLGLAKHQRSQPWASGAKALPGARPSPASATSRLASASESPKPSSSSWKKAYMPPLAGATARPAAPAAAAPGCRGRFSGGPPRAASPRRCADRHQRGALGEHAGAGGVELDELAHVVRHGRPASPASPGASRSSGSSWRSCAPPPAGRRGRRRPGSWARSARRGLVVQPLVDLVGQDPGAGLAAMRQDGLLLGARQRPAGGVVRRVDDQQLGGRRDGGQQRRPGRASRRPPPAAATRAAGRRP
jgi:hypothetical protein